MEGIDNSSARILPQGTVAFCRTASVGKVAILGLDMATSQDFVNWVCGPKVLPEYLYYAFRSSEAEFDRLKQGSTHKTIYMPVAERFTVLLPPLSEQRRIATILDKADAIRRKREEGIRLTEELLRSTFLEMFGDPVSNTRQWASKSVGDLAEVQGGLQLAPFRDSHPIKVPYLRVANVYRDRLDLREIKQIGCTSGELARVRLLTGDILVVEGHGNREEIGRAAIWDGSIDDCVHQNHLIRVRASCSEIEPAYLNAFINSEGGRRQLIGFGKTTSGLNTISVSNVRQVTVLVPPLQLQRLFSARILKVKSLLISRQRVYREGETLFRGLIQRAFRGEL